MVFDRKELKAGAALAAWAAPRATGLTGPGARPGVHLLGTVTHAGSLGGRARDGSHDLPGAPPCWAQAWRDPEPPVQSGHVRGSASSFTNVSRTRFVPESLLGTGLPPRAGLREAFLSKLVFYLETPKPRRETNENMPPGSDKDEGTGRERRGRRSLL